MKHLVMALTLLFAGSTLSAQVLPGYERTRTDQVHNKGDRDDMKRVEEEIEGLQALDVSTWKQQAVTWGVAEFEGQAMKIGSEDPRFYDMQKARTKKADSELSVDQPVVALALKKKNRNLWLTLPERAGGQEVKCKLDGAEGSSELFGVFLLQNSGFVCLSRAAS